ncbi:Ff.00g003120.m01.CDS01 [Fusarium sp. VM40]|nr:Ff.00g003120.m01.CDS01 [Fusarium sp. VM40]
MAEHIVFHPQLTKADTLILEGLRQDIKEYTPKKEALPSQNGKRANGKTETEVNASQPRDEDLLRHLQALNNPKDAHFEPSVTTNWEMDQIKLPIFLEKFVLRPYIRIGQSIVRVETDVIMLTHLLLYFSTSVPSAIYLFYNFNWIHGILHFLMQFTYMGSYTLLMHQHIHMRGVLNKKFALFDHLYPYITDPLMGHTWNSYFYHHVKHHHVEGNGPNDLSSTIRYQRDSLLHFLHYFGRFFFLVWADLPIYFVRTGKMTTGLKAGFWEFSNYAMLITLFNLHRNATICVFLMPLLLMRFGLMAGNWGQHAFVDDVEPDSDYRSSITLIDVASNRFCYNDGYHTSHHLNPLRHWREHPVSFHKTKQTYADQHAIVFHDIDYFMLTIRLLMKDYKTLAKCLVPIGDQIALTMDERITMLKRHTRPFTEEEIRTKFKKQ